MASACGNLRKGTSRLDSRQRKDAREQALDELEQLVFGWKGHLHVDLRELRLSVGPQILIAETARNLDIPVEPRHHENLLEELGDCGSA